ncbi:hemagglutinin repeat-containing protein [Glaesserella parasuis]|uniref:hemagglutinin repeat-containing protein n=1 Tax=Glaesserella parasuis TaxID=738 RepID=UPI0024365796|nr:hemagglutinin repeat-containing protein [Glaesserella parasuis]MDG6231483.1 hemagglutinin repeat-containing protein [Glaesserella parasuis]
MIKILQILVVNLPLVFDRSGVSLASGTDLIASKELGKAIDAIQKAGSVSEGLANSDAKISISIGTSKSVSTSHTKQTTHQGSELSAGSVTVRATEGDNTLVGAKINAKEATLEGNNVTLLGTTDSQKPTAATTRAAVGVWVCLWGNRVAQRG